MTLSGTDSRVRARVVPAAATTTPTSTASATTPPASRNIVVVVSTAASTAQAIVQVLRRWRATTHMSRPAASRVRVTARPTLRSGQVSAAQAPIPRAASTVSGCTGTPFSGHMPSSAPPPPPGTPGRGAAGGGETGCRRGTGAAVARVRRRWRAGGGRRCRHGALLTQVGGPAGAGAPGQDGAQVRTGGSGGGGQRRDDAAVQLADPARDGQAEPGAAGVVAAGAEPVEDPLHAVGRDAGAVVADLEPPGVLADAAGDDPHLSPGRAVPHRVVDEVGDELGEPGRVGDHGEVGRVRLVDHAHRPAADQGLRDPVAQQVTDLHLGEAQRRRPGVDPRQVEQVADEGAEPLALGERGAQGVVVGAHDAVDEVLEEGALGGQRGAQLVRDRGHELAALLVGARQVGGHRVERAGQRAHLVRGGCRDPLRVVAARHPPRGDGHLAQRRRHPAGQPLGDRQRGGDRDRHAHPPRHLGHLADPRHDDGDDHAGADEQAELDLDRGDAVERPVGVHGATSRA